MRGFIRLLAAGMLLLITGTVYSQTFATGSFYKVIVSPFIGATFIQGHQERVVINSSVVDADKLHIETKNGTLRVYLEGAKEIPQNPRGNTNDKPLYPKHAVSATIYYKTLDELSLRGEEEFSFPGSLSAEHFTLKLYGESAISFAEVHIDHLHTTIYGTSSVQMQSGSVNKQTHICYGEGRINTSTISSSEAKLTAYGEADFAMNVSDRIKLTSFGEAKLRYRGNPQIEKGIRIGDVNISRID